VHAIACLTAAQLQMHRLLPQDLTSFSGYHKLQWLSQASVANTINTPVLWAVHIYHCLAMAEDMAYKTSKAFCLSCR